MKLFFDESLVSDYKSMSQKIRVMSESWVKDNIYCPCCGNDILSQFENNRPVADFFCDNCGETFELKSKEGKIGKKIADGAYQTAIKRITSNSNPDLFVLRYSAERKVIGLEIIPKFFFTPEIIEKRKTLAQTARRAGWIGCNILYADVPPQGKISIIDNSLIIPKENVLNSYVQSMKLKTDDIAKREWLFDILQCVNKINSEFFTLKDVYKYEALLFKKHPLNNNIRAKIRQQLQILRDKGFIRFLGNGHYQKII